tara:strand:- start:201 stop:1379 length:1179 start_codon:yes stop_codon:yes gene_type:complete
MEGGKQLAEGGYGCVFHPEINCKGEETTNKKYISKVQQEDFSAKNETEIGKVLYDMYKSDPAKPLEVNFAPVISSCPINVRKISAPDINNCSIINKVIDRTTNFVIMKIRYIDMKDFDKYVIENADANLIIFTLLSSYNHLLKSINLLINAKIIHLDLKGQNIVFDTKRATPIIIDFGLSVPLYKNIELSNFFYIYEPGYYIWPIEVHYINLLLHHEEEPVDRDLKDLADRYVKANAALYPFSVGFKKKYTELIFKTLKKYNDTDKEYINDKIIKESWKTWDNYSLSIIYLKFINFIGHTQDNEMLNNNLINFFVKLTLQNIHPDYTKRLTIAETQRQFNTFLYNEQNETIASLGEITEEITKNKQMINQKLKRNKNIIKIISEKVVKSRKV